MVMGTLPVNPFHLVVPFNAVVAMAQSTLTSAVGGKLPTGQGVIVVLISALPAPVPVAGFEGPENGNLSIAPMVSVSLHLASAVCL